MIFTYPAKVAQVIDGDTIRLTLDLGLHVYRVENCRIAELYAPETSTEAGKAARAYAATLLPIGSAVTFKSERLDKYGRPLGSLTLPNGEDFATKMISARHGEVAP